MVSRTFTNKDTASVSIAEIEDFDEVVMCRRVKLAPADPETSDDTK